MCSHKQEELAILKTALRRYFFVWLIQKLTFGFFDLPYGYEEGFCNYFRARENRIYGIPRTLEEVYKEKKEAGTANPIYIGPGGHNYFWYHPGELYPRIQILNETIERLKNEENND